MSFKSLLEQERQAGRFKSRVVFGLIFLMSIMAIGWSMAPTDIRLHYPPDLRSGAVMKINEISEAEVFVFTNYILQQLNNWPVNGEKDYLSKIQILRAYFTPEYQAYLKDDYEQRKRQGELRNRVRIWSLLPGSIYRDEFVQPLGRNWLVWLDVSIKEFVNGGIVKNLKLRVPMQVVRYDVDPESNPWGLGLNGPGNYQPSVIEVKK